jgi:hypothetical protein
MAAQIKKRRPDEDGPPQKVPRTARKGESQSQLADGTICAER